ncbi:MAG: ATP-binding protein [Candidatus Eisenbacteria bacterium]
MIIFVLYASAKHRALNERESQLRLSAAREDALRERLAELSALLETTTEMAQSLDLSTMLELAARRIRACLEADHVSLMLLNPSSGLLEVKAASGLDAELAQLASVKPGEGIVGSVYVAAEPQVFGQEPVCARLSAELRLTRRACAAVCVPLRVKGSPIGLLNVVRTEEGESFAPSHLRTLQAFAEHLAAAFVKTFQYQRLLRGNETVQHEREEQFRTAQKMEAIGRLAAGVAHDFNNLLTVVTSYAHLVSDHSADEQCVRDYAREIVDAGEKAAVLTRQLLAFSRQQVLEPRTLDLNALVNETQGILRSTIGEEVELLTVLDPKLGRVCADPGQIMQVILDLVINARDAMPKGGKITIETTNTVIDGHLAHHIVTDRPGRYAMLAVTDTGVGIDRATKARIFEPFFTTKEPGKGTGLGLSAVYGIVRQSGGHITCYSEPEWGTSFKVYLPLEDEAADTAASRGPVAQTMGNSSYTVLLVEDEDMVRGVGRTILADAGYNVLVAPDGAEALRILEQHAGPIHLLLTDIVMPKMSGPDLVTQLTAKRPEVAVLYMSGYPEGSIVRHGVLARGVNFVGKPFTPQTLTLKVREVLAAAPRHDAIGAVERADEAA